jgi:hypothetical protein
MTIIPRGSTSVMAQRREPPAAFDYFPTQLWSTRALFRHVLPAIGAGAISGCRAALTHANDRRCFPPCTLAPTDAPLFSPHPSGTTCDTTSDIDATGKRR